MAIKVGLLSATQARAYEFKGLRPDPKHHRHIPASLVLQLVGREDNGMGYLRWVGTDWLIENRVRVVGNKRHGEFRLGSAAVTSSRELRQRSAPPTPEGTSLFPELPPQERHRDDG
jgi:hypothetical protein